LFDFYGVHARRLYGIVGMRPPHAPAHLFLHALLITLFVTLTAPVTTIFLMRAALFRERLGDGKASGETR
jgi:multisubunit Na+/H+ antiporter MnhG subunit